MKDLKGRVAVITGGASGIGLSAARSFARVGMKLVLADIDSAALERAVSEFTSSGTEAIAVVTDVGARGDIERLADAAWARFGGVHLLFNNAGIAVYGDAQTLRQEEWEWSLRINLWGAINGVSVFLPRLLAQNEPAHIVNNASLAGLLPSHSMPAYNVAKAGVVSLTESLRQELRGTQIGTTVVCPMRVATNVWQTSAATRPDAIGGAATFRKRSDEETAAMSGAILDADAVAGMILDAVHKNQLYLVTHEEARPFIKRHWERIDASFEQ